MKQTFQEPYNRKSFEENLLIPIFQDSVKDFTLYSESGVQEIPLNETEKRTAKRIIKYGKLTTHDNRTIDLYEVIMQNTKQVQYARVGLVALIKMHIIGNNGAFATFITDKHWRFSFIAYDSFFKEGKVHTKSTNPKRYTYVFGDEEETYRTAIARFTKLQGTQKINIKDIQEAFSVEAVSKEFFDEYREIHYANFVKYLTGEAFQKKGGKYELVKVQDPSPFLASVFNGDTKQVRDFCKKLLGQIVFLYFIQKKGWLGATNTAYKERNGDKNFLQNFYKQTGENDSFYPLWLSKLFYDTLNRKRENDDFTMPNGKIVKIPYLNGGLFEKESDEYDYLTFPHKLFTDLFEFFNRFNFTIYENSPEEHTIAVDPEMLGNIFENLLEDNKDKGTFYTPKEIVQYMTQESLIAYLTTHSEDSLKEGISRFVRQKDKNELNDDQLNKISALLDKVKICDPAIGSGAFPMGLLHEIFALKECIAFELGFKVWSPATVKGNIIQNSIYGVDIEKGAVDIARLRFWLSLIVDEETPKPLPNLAYKIVVGNSLVSMFGDEVLEIHWDTDSTKGGLLGHNFIVKRTQLLETISEKQKVYFTADSVQKDDIKKKIRGLKLEILSIQLELMIKTKGLEKLDNPRSKVQTTQWLATQGWKNALTQINALKTNDKPFDHFDWQLDFPEVMNPIIHKDKVKRGFDIVIGNPPYLRLQGIKKSNPDFVAYAKANYKSATKGNWDLYVLFMEQGYKLLKANGTFAYIQPHKFFQADFGVGIRKLIANEKALMKVVHFGAEQMFNSATNYTCLLFLTKKPCKHFEFINAFNLEEWRNAQQGKQGYWLDQPTGDKEWNFQDPKTQKILTQISKQPETLADITRKIFVGLQTSADKIYVLKILEKLKSEYRLFSNELQKEVVIEKGLLQPFLMGKDVKRYQAPDHAHMVIFPYTIEKQKGLLMTQDFIAQHFPKGWEYLQSVRTTLENRENGKMKHENFYAYIYPKNLTEFESVKIMTPEIANRPELTIDHKGLMYHTTKVYSFVFHDTVKESRYYWLGLLNAKLLWYFLINTGYVLRGNFYVFKTNYLSPFPVRRIDFDNDYDKTTHDRIANLTKTILSKKAKNEDTTPEESKIDALVYQLYGLSAEEIEIVEKKTK